MKWLGGLQSELNPIISFGCAFFAFGLGAVIFMPLDDIARYEWMIAGCLFGGLAAIFVGLVFQVWQHIRPYKEDMD